MLRIAVCQLPLDIENPDANVKMAKMAIKEAASQGARLVVLPELTNSGCVFKNAAELEVRATTLDGQIVKDWIALASELNLVLVAGLAIKDCGRFYNASVIIDSSGFRGWYKKVHLWGNESDYFTAGNDAPLIVDTKIGRVATMVCYDVEFPEWVRLAMLGDTNILALPLNWPDSGRPVGTTPLATVLIQAAAAQNKLVVAAADRTRTERGIVWAGSSVISDSDGIIRNIADGENTSGIQILIADVEVPLDRMMGPRNDARSDRRPDLYKEILTR